MPEPVTLASCAFFGVRKDREPEKYYRLLLNDLAKKKGAARLVVATNDPTDFDPAIEVVLVTSIDEYRKRIWDVDDPDQEVVRLFDWSWRNTRLDEYQMPGLVSVYLAKSAITCELARRFGKIVWLDAGLLFSVVYDHRVPEVWEGYSQERLEHRLQPLAHESTSLFVAIPRQWRLFKNNRPHFHGLSYNDMARFARAAGTLPDDTYTAAGAMVLDAATAAQMETEMARDWRLMTEMGRCGTEENALSVFRWRNRLPGMDLKSWMALLTDVPPEQFERRI
ncbi:MAG: hypothetical protein JSS65_02715 [Armatimonadetes bacterium]|nr:hypothetical protein [Armatimonadota bacterium]